MLTKYGAADAQTVPDGVGGDIYYRDQGIENSTVILFVHGSAGSSHVWEQVATDLSRDFRVISFDQHGHGLTGPHAGRDYTAAARINAATRVLDATQVEKAVWVGNSMGGWVAWRAGLSVPDRVSGLVLINSAGVISSESPKLSWGFRLSASSFGKLFLPYITPKSLVRAATEHRYSNPSKVTDELVTRFWELMRFPGNRQATVDQMNTSREPQEWHNIAAIDAPALILWGEQDLVFSMSHAESFKNAIHASQLISYADAGHLPMLEVPDKVAADIRGWLR